MREVRTFAGRCTCQKMHTSIATHRVTQLREPDIFENPRLTCSARSVIDHFLIGHCRVVTGPDASGPKNARRTQPDLLNHGQIKLVRDCALKRQLDVVAAEEETAGAARGSGLAQIVEVA